MIDHVWDVLIEVGYVVVPNIIPQYMADRLATASDQLALQQNDPLQTLRLPQENPIFRSLIDWFPTRKLLERHHPYFQSGTFINKKPFEPARPWHQDWWYWPDPVSNRDVAPLLGVMYYFRGSTIENGCLRVIPGSHRKWHTIHQQYSWKQYADEIQRKSLDQLAVQSYPDEIPVEAGPTDVVLMDGRILHSTYANQTSRNRVAVNLWHILRMDDMLSTVQNYIRYGKGGGRPVVSVDADTCHPKRHQLL